MVDGEQGRAGGRGDRVIRCQGRPPARAGPSGSVPGRPRQFVLPKLSTVTPSDRFINILTSWLTTTTVTPISRMLRMMSSTFSISLAPMPEAGSSRRRSLGAAMSARAICTSWRSVQTRSAAQRRAEASSPTRDRMRRARASISDSRAEGTKGSRSAASRAARSDRVVDARHDVFDHGQARYELARLERPPDALVGDDLGSLPRDSFTFETDGAGIGFEHAGDAVEEGGLSRTVRTDDAVDGAFFDPEIHSVQRLNRSEGFAQP